MKNTVLTIAALLYLNTCIADSWYFEKELKEESFLFGNTEVTRIIDTRKNDQHPIYRVKVKYNGVEEANYKNLTFNKIISFDKGSYLLGVSNSGLSSFAYFILTSSGDLVKAVNHSEQIHYCRQSVTLRREWVDLTNLKANEVYKTIENEFNKKDPYIYLESVKILGCNGKSIEIWSN